MIMLTLMAWIMTQRISTIHPSLTMRICKAGRSWFPKKMVKFTGPELQKSWMNIVGNLTEPVALNIRNSELA